METLEIIQSDYELERGKPMPTWNHALLQKRITYKVEGRYEGTYYVMPELNVSILDERLIPDLTIFAGSDSFLAHDKTTMTELPLIAVEILSPSQHVSELVEKARRYLEAGVKSCWIVVPEFMQIVVTTQVGNYQSFNRHDTLVDPATGIELELAPLFS